MSLFMLTELTKSSVKPSGTVSKYRDNGKQEAAFSWLLVKPTCVTRVQTESQTFVMGNPGGR